MDEASREHDNWYRYHKKENYKWVADNILQQKSIDRVVSENSEISERVLALGTTR